MADTFDKYPLKPELLKTLAELKFHSMTPIQAMALPHVLSGLDVIGQAKTGSGKTATFGLGILNSITEGPLYPQALVLCPTRELAEQVAKDLRSLARGLKNIKILTLCGGVPESEHRGALQKGAHIIVGTPGRVLQLLRTMDLMANDVKTYVLDEADKMLGMGFYEDIISLSNFLPKNRQTLLFSATFTEESHKLSEELQTNAKSIKVDTEHIQNEIHQVFYEIRPGEDKNAILYKLLNFHQPDRAIVFCRTKKESTDLAEFLSQRGVFASYLNGDLEQKDRAEVLIKFSNRSLSVLVATDIAARGLDIQDLPAVINFNMPATAEDYIHRIGRTGRAENTGKAYNFFTDYERALLGQIESALKQKCIFEETSEIPAAKNYSPNPPMRTIYINGGKKDKLRPGDIVGALIGEAKLLASDIGDIDILNSQSFVAIRANLVKKAVDSLSAGKIKKRKYKVGLA